MPAGTGLLGPSQTAHLLPLRKLKGLGKLHGWMHLLWMFDSERPHQAKQSQTSTCFRSPVERKETPNSQTLTDERRLFGTRLLPKWALHVELVVKWPCRELLGLVSGFARFFVLEIASCGLPVRDSGKQGMIPTAC